MITVGGVDEMVRNLSRFSDKALERVAAAAQIAQARIVNDAKNDHPYKDRTGNLTNSIQPGIVQITDAEVDAYVEARMQYASFVEFGTSRAHAYPFLTPAMLRYAPQFREDVAREMQRVTL